MGLTYKQQVFVAEYLQCWNASEAARRAGYEGKSNVIGPRLLANVSIKEAIEAEIEARAMSANEVLLRLADQARGSIEDFIDTNGAINLKQARAAGKLHLLKSYSLTDKGTRIEMYDAQAALVHLGRHHKLFTDNVDVRQVDVTKLSDDELRNIVEG